MNRDVDRLRDIVPPRVWTLVRQVAEQVCRGLGDDATVIWFGSWVAGRAAPHSDIDLAISSPHGINPIRYARLADWIDELPTLYSVDLVNLHEASPRLRGEIASQGIELP
jgi:predicted nucleotidyltransferase